MQRFMKRILEDSDKRVSQFLRWQCLDAASTDFGGSAMGDRDIDVKETFIRLGTAIACWLHPESRYHRDAKLAGRMDIALDYLVRMQHSDGTYDFPNCNFASAPDTAFMVQEVIPSCHLLGGFVKAGGTAVSGELVQTAVGLMTKIRMILERAGHGMATGGFHTPNHRWAIASVLLAVNEIVPDVQFREVSNTYLVEGIDSNEDGEYAERSAAIYNVVNNDAMLRLFEATGDRHYLDCARKNLTMMLHYFEPDGSVFTANSTRQDKGRKMYPVDYIPQYLFVSDAYGDKQLEGAALALLDCYVNELRLPSPDMLDLLMLHPTLVKPLSGEAFPTGYDRLFKSSGIRRIRRGGLTATLLANNTQFFSFQCGKLAMTLRIGASWFEHRHFKAKTIEEVDGVNVMTFTAPAWYYLPFGADQGTSDWWQMKQEDRHKVFKDPLEIRIEVRMTDDGPRVRMTAGGCDRVPLRLELTVDAGVTVQTEHFHLEGMPNHCMLVKQGDLKIALGEDRVTVGPAFGGHRFIRGKEGSEPRSEHHQTFYFTDLTPFSHEIRFDGEPESM